MTHQSWDTFRQAHGIPADTKNHRCSVAFVKGYVLALQDIEGDVDKMSRPKFSDKGRQAGYWEAIAGVQDAIRATLAQANRTLERMDTHEA